MSICIVAWFRQSQGKQKTYLFKPIVDLLSSDDIVSCCQCSVSCGKGKQERTVQCQSFNGKPCDPALKPAAVQECNSPCSKRPDVESKCLHHMHFVPFGVVSVFKITSHNFLLPVPSDLLLQSDALTYVYRRNGREENGQPRGPSPWSSRFPRKATCSSARTTERSDSSLNETKSC